MNVTAKTKCLSLIIEMTFNSFKSYHTIQFYFTLRHYLHRLNFRISYTVITWAANCHSSVK